MSRKISTPDLVLLSLLAERPMHGYQANLELERREVRDWAGISRPQVYYSLEKLAEQDLIRSAESEGPQPGPERNVFATTGKGRATLADALENEDWTNQRDRPAFLTWLALSWQARPGVFVEQVRRRQKFLEKELAREQATLRAIRKEVGHRFHEAVWMVSLVIEQFRVELRWLRKLASEAPRRAPARHPTYATKDNAKLRRPPPSIVDPAIQIAIRPRWPADRPPARPARTSAARSSRARSSLPSRRSRRRS
jgi:DNA-binding PadR family transcriptional regulator